MKKHNKSMSIKLYISNLNFQQNFIKKDDYFYGSNRRTARQSGLTTLLKILLKRFQIYIDSNYK